MSNWKGQLKLVEDKNTAHVQANLELQEVRSSVHSHVESTHSLGPVD